MKVAEFIKNGFNNTSFTATNKASNIALSVSLFINFHKLKCPIVYNYRNLFNFGVCKLKVLKALANNQKLHCVLRIRDKKTKENMGKIRISTPG